MKTLQTAYIGLGSNLSYQGHAPRELLKAAVAALATLGEPRGLSRVYQTEPVGYADQPVFLNAVAAFATELGPEDVLDELLRAERRFGRDRLTAMRNGPRTLDLDLLLLDGVVMATARLTLPHPRLAERRFVLTPLAEVVPEMVHPVLGQTMEQLLEALPDSGEQRVAAVTAVD